MLLLNATNIVKTSSAALLPGVEISEEGLALVYVRDLTTGDLCVQPSQGIAGEEFAGFAIARNTPPSFLPHVEKGSVPASGSVLLARVPVAGQLLVLINGKQAVLSSTGTQPTAAGTVDISGATLRFAAADVGAVYQAQFQYEPTVSEANFMTGNVAVGGLSANVMDVVGFVELGDIATNLFDASCDWSKAMHPKLGAGGKLTTTGNGTVLPNVLVKTIPVSQDNGFLVLTAK